MEIENLKEKKEICGNCRESINVEDKFCGNCGDKNINPSLSQSENDLKTVDNSEIKNKIKKFKWYWMSSLFLVPSFSVGLPRKADLLINPEYLLNYGFSIVGVAIIEFSIAMLIVKSYKLKSKSDEYYLRVYRIAFVLNIILLVGNFLNLNS